MISRVETPDKYTVRFRLTKPYSPFIQTYFSSAGNGQCVLPKHLLAKLPNINEAAYNGLPVGIGPFKYERWNRGEKIVMVQNRLYFRGPPRLHEIDYEIIPDTNTLATALQSHLIEMWYRVPVSDYIRLKGTDHISYLEHPGFEVNEIDFNTEGVLRDRNLRLALEYAINRPELQHAVLRGTGVLQEEPAPPASAYFDQDFALIRRFDIAKARRLVKEGHRTLNLQVAIGSGHPATDLTVELLRSWWEKLGVKLIVRRYNPAILFGPYESGGIIARGKFDVALLNKSSDLIGDFSNDYACDKVPPYGENDTRWCNQAATNAMHRLVQEYSATDRARQVKIVLAELQRDVPMIVTSIPTARFLLSADLRNFHPGAITSFDNMMNVDI